MQHDNRLLGYAILGGLAQGSARALGVSGVAAVSIHPL
jgi:hypothetical protein